jgi:hypothetical protein
VRQRRLRHKIARARPLDRALTEVTDPGLRDLMDEAARAD